MRNMSTIIKAKVTFYLQELFRYFREYNQRLIKKPRRKFTKGRSKTIRHTLDNLDSNFKELSRATNIKYSWEDKTNVKGLKKLGVFVPPPDTDLEAEWQAMLKCPILKIPKKYPGIMFVATNEFVTTDDLIMPTFFYAMLLDRPPCHVEPTTDTMYKMGVCWPGGSGTQRSIWLYFYVAIDSQGAVRTLRWVTDTHVEIPLKRGRSTHYIHKEWKKPCVLNPDREYKIDKELAHIALFCICFNFWHKRHKMWTVETRKNNLRMSFCVDTKDTKHYFKDREYITTANGHRKKIIHFVGTHTRVTPTGESIIREHIRGERKFVWNEYTCNVKAPKFNNTTTMADFTVGSFELDKDDPAYKTSIDLVRVANELTPMWDKEQDNIYSTKVKG